jgi:hypothetical protein
MIVYGVYYNVDMTEGRGPMKLSRLYLHREHAVKFMDKQSGVMGRKPGTTNKTLHPGCQTWDCVKCWGTHGSDWRVEPHEVLETAELLPAEKREAVATAVASLQDVLQSLHGVRMSDNDKDRLRSAQRILEDLQD